jgi:hypothetical protein
MYGALGPAGSPAPHTQRELDLNPDPIPIPEDPRERGGG